MLAPCLIGVLCGLLIGSRFKVFALIIAQFAALLLTIGLGLFSPLTFAHAMAGLACWSLMLQVGYLGMLTAGARTTRSLQPSTHGA